MKTILACVTGFVALLPAVVLGAPTASLAPPVPSELSLAQCALWSESRGAALFATSSSNWPESDWDWVDKAPPKVDTGEKSVLTALAASALLPGLGERYTGHTRRATLFHAIEGVIWTTFAFYRIQGDIRRDRYIEFANLQGGAPRDGDSDYYEHIGLWLSLAEWHDIVRRDARFRFPDDATAQSEFFEATKRYDSSENWNWPDDETRVEYRRLRSRSERSLRNSRLAAGAAIINRLASVVDAVALARSHNRELEQARARIDFRIAPRSTVDGLVVGPVLTTQY